MRTQAEIGPFPVAVQGDRVAARDLVGRLLQAVDDLDLERLIAFDHECPGLSRGHLAELERVVGGDAEEGDEGGSEEDAEGCHLNSPFSSRLNPMEWRRAQ